VRNRRSLALRSFAVGLALPAAACSGQTSTSGIDLGYAVLDPRVRPS
jgi:hypothetical protein